jgi:hypothetical protein
MPTNPFRQLHPTLKKCKCGLTATKKDFNQHMDQVATHYNRCGMTLGEFFADHGEIPHYEAEPRERDFVAQAAKVSKIAHILDTM